MGGNPSKDFKLFPTMDNTLSCVNSSNFNSFKLSELMLKAYKFLKIMVTSLISEHLSLNISV